MADQMPGVRIARSYRDMVMASEAAQQARLANTYNQMLREARAEERALARVLSEDSTQGRLTYTRLSRLPEFRDYVAALRRASRGAGDVITRSISTHQNEYIEMGLRAGRDILKTYGITVKTNDLYKSLAHIPGTAGERGKAISSLVSNALQVDGVLGVARKISGESFYQKAQSYISAVIRDAAEPGLSGVLGIARTEQMRAYRKALFAAYGASDEVIGYRRLSKRDKHTCLSCLVMDTGQVYPLSEPFAEHPHGRCIPMPVIRGQANDYAESGVDWLANQSDDVQKDIMGPGRWKLWNEGEVKLSSFVSVRQSDEWGPTVVVRSIKEVMGR